MQAFRDSDVMNCRFENFIALAGLVVVAACGTPTPDSYSDLALTPASQGLPNDALYAGLPTGPKDTDTYLDFRDEPVGTLTTTDSARVRELTQQMRSLEDANSSRRISTAQYKARLKRLRELARQHSPAMLRKIEAERVAYTSIEDDS